MMILNVFVCVQIIMKQYYRVMRVSKQTATARSSINAQQLNARHANAALLLQTGQASSHNLIDK